MPRACNSFDRSQYAPKPGQTLELVRRFFQKFLRCQVVTRRLLSMTAFCQIHGAVSEIEQRVCVYPMFGVIRKANTGADMDGVRAQSEGFIECAANFLNHLQLVIPLLLGLLYHHKLVTSDPGYRVRLPH